MDVPRHRLTGSRVSPSSSVSHVTYGPDSPLKLVTAIVIVVLVGSLNDWQKERQFRVLNEKKDDRKLKVIRGGVEQQINVKVRTVVCTLQPTLLTRGAYRTYSSVMSPFSSPVKSYLSTVCSFKATMSSATSRARPVRPIRSRRRRSRPASRNAATSWTASSSPVPRFSRALAPTSSLLSVRGPHMAA